MAARPSPLLYVNPPPLVCSFSISDSGCCGILCSMPLTGLSLAPAACGTLAAGYYYLCDDGVFVCVTDGPEPSAQNATLAPVYPMAVVGCHKVPPSYTLGIQGPAGRTLRGVLNQHQSIAKSHTLARLLAHLAHRLRPHENFQFFSLCLPSLPSPASSSLLTSPLLA